MVKNLACLTNAANRLEAWKDWDAIAIFAEENDQTALALAHKPPNDAGWRKIDKALAGLREELIVAGLDVPPNPSST